MPSYNYAPFAIARIRANKTEDCITWRTAARLFYRQYPEAACKTMDEIGCYPNSEPELRALQAVF